MKAGWQKGAGVGAGAGRTQGLTELLPSQQEALAAGSLGPRGHGSRRGRQGTLGAEPAQPSKAASNLFTQAHSSAPPFALTLAPLPKISDPCGQEHVAAPCLLQPPGKLVNLQCQGLPRSLPALGLCTLCSLCLESPHHSLGLAHFHLSFRSLLLYHFLQEAFPDWPIRGTPPWVYHAVLSLQCPHSST